MKINLKPWVLSFIILLVISAIIFIGIPYYFIAVSFNEQEKMFEKWISRYEPNVFVLANPNGEGKTLVPHNYPANIGYIFGEGLTSNINRADIYYQNRTIIVPCGYIYIPPESSKEDSYVIQQTPISTFLIGKYVIITKSGSQVIIEPIRQNSVRGTISNWFTYQYVEIDNQFVVTD